MLTDEESSRILGPLEDAVVIPGFTLILYDSNQYMGASTFLFVLIILTIWIIALLPLVGRDYLGRYAVLLIPFSPTSHGVASDGARTVHHCSQHPSSFSASH